jgi:hypothetical protein
MPGAGWLFPKSAPGILGRRGAVMPRGYASVLWFGYAMPGAGWLFPSAIDLSLRRSTLQRRNVRSWYAFQTISGHLKMSIVWLRVTSWCAINASLG